MGLHAGQLLQKVESFADQLAKHFSVLTNSKGLTSIIYFGLAVLFAFTLDAELDNLERPARGASFTGTHVSTRTHLFGLLFFIAAIINLANVFFQHAMSVRRMRKDNAAKGSGILGDFTLASFVKDLDVLVEYAVTIAVGFHLTLKWYILTQVWHSSDNFEHSFLGLNFITVVVLVGPLFILFLLDNWGYIHDRTHLDTSFNIFSFENDDGPKTHRRNLFVHHTLRHAALASLAFLWLANGAQRDKHLRAHKDNYFYDDYLVKDTYDNALEVVVYVFVGLYWTSIFYVKHVGLHKLLDSPSFFETFTVETIREHAALITILFYVVYQKYILGSHWHDGDDTQWSNLANGSIAILVLIGIDIFVGLAHFLGLIKHDSDANSFSRIGKWSKEAKDGGGVSAAPKYRTLSVAR